MKIIANEQDFGLLLPPCILSCGNLQHHCLQTKFFCKSLKETYFQIKKQQRYNSSYCKINTLSKTIKKWQA